MDLGGDGWVAGVMSTTVLLSRDRVGDGGAGQIDGFGRLRDLLALGLAALCMVVK